MGTAGVWVIALRSLHATDAPMRAGLVLLVLVGSGLSVLALPLSAAHAPLDPGAAAGSCPGATDSPGFAGQLSLTGGPVSPSIVGGVRVAYSYWQQSVTQYVSNDTVVSEDCAYENGTVRTDAGGGFSFSISAPGESCAPIAPSGEACTTYSAPYGRVSVSVLTSPPAGYGLSESANRSFFALAWVADLATVTVRPSGNPVVVSSGAASSFVATPRMANGTVSPFAPTFRWKLDGTGWSFATPPGARATATVVAAPGARRANLTVQATTARGTNTFVTPAVVLPLVSVATTLGAGAVNRTAIDAGSAVAVSVTATGAAGYSYTATVSPGLGLEPASAPCSSSPFSPTAVAVRCATSVVYPTPGVAQISVRVSNGFSGATWSSPNVTVAPAPTLQLAPASPIGYVGIPIPITLSVAPGTGVPPYSLACFDSTAGPPDCQATPGPTWTFFPSFPSAANYSARAWVLDAAQVNRSVPVTVQVWGALSVSPPAPSSSNVSAGTAVTLSSALFGGVLPVQVWWNVSDQSGPLSTYRVAADGPLSVGFVPRTLGPVRIALTVRDSLGTDAATSLTLPVTVGPAASVAAAGSPPTGPVVVGSPVSLAWQALDAAGDLVPTFDGAGALSVVGAGGAPALAWVNVSGGRSLSSAPEGSFVVQPSDWANGTLNLTFTPVSAGVLTVTLGGPGIPGAVPSLSVAATADAAHLRLFAPQVALPGDRVNHTYWRVSDRYGNPVPGALVTVQYSSAGASVERSVAVNLTSGGGTGVWLNYSLPDPGVSFRVLDAAGEVLLGPIEWTAAPSPAPPVGPATVLLAASGVGATVALTSAAVRPRGRRTAGPDDEVAARQLAEGRATVVEILRASGAARWEEIAGAWEPPPPPADLAEWLASLVADGTVLTGAFPDGPVEYRLAPPAPDSPQIVVDEAALADAVARREALVHDDEGRS